MPTECLAQSRNFINVTSFSLELITPTYFIRSLNMEWGNFLFCSPPSSPLLQTHKTAACRPFSLQRLLGSCFWRSSCIFVSMHCPGQGPGSPGGEKRYGKQGPAPGAEASGPREEPGLPAHTTIFWVLVGSPQGTRTGTGDIDQHRRPGDPTCQGQYDSEGLG